MIRTNDLKADCKLKTKQNKRKEEKKNPETNLKPCKYFIFNFQKKSQNASQRGLFSSRNEKYKTKATTTERATVLNYCNGKIFLDLKQFVVAIMSLRSFCLLFFSIFYFSYRLAVKKFLQPNFSFFFYFFCDFMLEIKKRKKIQAACSIAFLSNSLNLRLKYF